MAHHRAATPLLCVVEARRDGFEGGRAQCLMEMAACRQKNQQEGHDADIFGIVSNGQGWRFYRLDTGGDVYQSGLYSSDFLPELLGALDYICGECARLVP